MSSKSKVIQTALVNLNFDSESPIFLDFVSIARVRRELPQLALALLDLYATFAELRAVVNDLMGITDVDSLDVGGYQVTLQLTLYKISPKLLPFIREFQERHLLSTLIGTMLKLFYHFKAFRTAVLVALVQKEPTSSGFYVPTPISRWVDRIDALGVPSVGRGTVSNDLLLSIRVYQGKACIVGSVRVVRGLNFVKGSVIYALGMDLNRLEPVGFYGSGKPLYSVSDVCYLVTQDQIIREGQVKGKASIYLPIGLNSENKLILRDISILYSGEKYADLYVKNFEFVQSQLGSAGMTFSEPQIDAIVD